MRIRCLSILAVSVLLAGRLSGETPAPAPDAVRTLTLPEFDPALPQAKGLNKVQVNCGVCHTPHYILLQPNLPRATWQAEVTKMIKVYSAPVPPENVEEIVEYLMAVRGAEK